MNEGIRLVDADDSSITVTWPAITSSSSSPTRYSLQYRPSTSPNDNGIDSGGSLLYTSLSTDLVSTTAKKNNLTGAGHGFWFRVSAATKSKTRVDKNATEYVEHACRKPFLVLSMMEESKRMPTPVVRIDSSAAAAASSQPNTYVAHVSWTPYEDPLLVGYKLQMRENEGGCKWSTVAQCLTGTEVRKKNLTSKHGYMFRVRPVCQGESGGYEQNLDVSVSEGGNTIPYSKASDVVGVRRSGGASASSQSGSSAVCTELLKLFKGVPNDKLLAKGGMSTISLSRAFAGVDLVFLYASAHWCGPCRKYTPQLIKFYNDARHAYSRDPKNAKTVEIVFLSADHDLNGFKNYYATMPWLAVPFDSSVRERLMSHIKVTGVPRLVCLDGRSGKTLESNSVGRALELGRYAKMIEEEDRRSQRRSSNH